MATTIIKPMNWDEACIATRGLVDYFEKVKRGAYKESAWLVFRPEYGEKWAVGAGNLMDLEQQESENEPGGRVAAASDKSVTRMSERVKMTVNPWSNGSREDCILRYDIS